MPRRFLKPLILPTPSLKWCWDLIDQQVGLMARLMEDLLDVSRISRDRLELRKQSVKLQTFIDAAVEIARPQIDAGGHRFTVHLPAETIGIEGDPARLTQVFANLLNNAAKYMEGSGEIRLTVTLGDQTEKDSPHEIIVSIKDADIGIAPEMQPHLFDMFFQGDSSKERRYGGLGIGLTLARRIVELHDGRIEVNSEGLGKGSEFIVRLPLTKASGALNKYLADAGKTTNQHSTLLSKRV